VKNPCEGSIHFHCVVEKLNSPCLIMNVDTYSCQPLPSNLTG
jgi:hypothetical protein